MKLNKIVLSLAGVMAAAAFAPEASAVPVFARQTGMACTACHFNHFPLLNSFGRAFKASGYTLMGAQAKVEGEDLSIPGQLNMAGLITAGYENNAAAPNNVGQVAQKGFYVPTNGGELSIFWGGRMTENSGFLSELGLTGPTSVGVPSAKFLVLPEVGNNTRVGFSVFSVGQDAAASFELLGTGATSIHRLMGRTSTHMAASSARAYVAPEKAGGAKNGSTGVSVIAVNTDLGYVNIAKYASVGPGSAIGGAGISHVAGLPGTYIRAVGFFNLAGFEGAAGVQNWTGYQGITASLGGANAGAAYQEERATVIDFQMQGDLNGHGLGIYAGYGTAPLVAGPAGGVAGNAFNAGVSGVAGATTKKALVIAADYELMHKTTLQGSYRSATEGTAGQGDNALMIGAAYELAMNQHLSFNYTTQSGSSWCAAATCANAGSLGKNSTTILLETLF